MSLPIVPVAAAAPLPAGTVWLGGIARNAAGALYITLDTPDATAVTTNGLLMTSQGVLYCEDATP